MEALFNVLQLEHIGSLKGNTLCSYSWRLLPCMLCACLHGDLFLLRYKMWWKSVHVMTPQPGQMQFKAGLTSTTILSMVQDQRAPGAIVGHYTQVSRTNENFGHKCSNRESFSKWWPTPVFSLEELEYNRILASGWYFISNHFYHGLHS